ncbi:MAG: ABC transporter ATP-binding protein [Roseivirga sp.]
MFFHVLFDLLSLISVLPLLLLFLDPESVVDLPIVQSIPDLGTHRLQDLKIILAVTIFVFFSLKALYSHHVLKKKADFMTTVICTITIKRFDDNLFDVFKSDKTEDTGEQVQNIIQIPEKYVFQSLRSLFDIYNNLLVCVIILTGLLFFRPDALLLMTILLLPGIAFFLNFLKKKTKDIKDNIAESTPQLIQHAVEGITGKLEIALAGKQGYFSDRFTSANKKLFENMGKLLTYSNTIPKVMELIAILGISSLFIYLAISQVTSEEAGLLFSVFAISTFRLIPSINGLVTGFINIKAYHYAIESLLDGPDKTAKPDPSAEKQDIVPFNKSIKLDQVSFSYTDSDFSIKNFSLEIPKGSSLALTGKSGSGKSTVLQLILRLLQEESGMMSVDNQAIQIAAREAWWEQISYVPPSSFLFKGSILENICFDHKPSTTDKKKIEALANELELKDLLTSLPKGLDSPLSENGNNLSTGQRQRLGILRAIWQNRPIMIFDEVTSSLDDLSRTKVMNMLAKIKSQNKTMIFATHDKKVMSLCDQVVNLS